MTAAAPRVPELDGLRGIAILLVLVGHLLGGVLPHGVPLIPGHKIDIDGGFTGVQLFFVLSGYLISSILLRDAATLHRIPWRRFYVRRLRRLMPALLGLCLVYLVYALVFLRGDALAGALGSIARAATYTTNLKPLLPHWPDSKWLSHAWSLGVEEQFYLLWPLVLWAAYRVGGRRAVGIVAIAGAVATAVLRELVAWKLEGTGPLFYYLFRWDALLLGCALAAFPWHPRRWVSLLGWAYLAWTTSRTGAGRVPLDYLATSLAAVLVLASWPDHRWLRNRVLVWFGSVSYGLYLWHVFLMRFGLPGIVSLILSLVAAQLSYVLIERRFLR